MRRWLLVFSLFNFLLNGCKKLSGSTTEFPVTGSIDLVTRVYGSVEGFVSGENNLPVSGAIVSFGAASAVTDPHGYFSFDSIAVIQSSAVISVTHSGYFKAVRNFEVTEGKVAFFRIQLLKAEHIGNFSAGSGGSISHPNGWSIDFLPGSIVNAATQQAYHGSVTVLAQWLNPTRSDLQQVMPGDLRAIDANGAAKYLSSYGMIGVELLGSAGERLQLGNNQKAALHFPIPVSLQANAPVNIPLWHFNESTGLWMEEGSAIKSGNTYTGTVAHFSFWNVDIPNLYITVKLKLISPQLQPIPGLLVKLTDVANPANIGFGLSNALGEVSGYVPKNHTYSLAVFSNPSCTQPIYSQTLIVGESDLPMTDIQLQTNSTLQLSGRVVDCQNAPVSRGKVFIESGGVYHVLPTWGNGQFSGAFPVCDGAVHTVSLLASDEVHQQQGPVQTYSLLPGGNSLGDLQACGFSTSEYMQLVVDSSIQFLVQRPGDTLYINQLPNATLSINGFQLANFNLNVAFNMSAQGMTTGSFQSLNQVASHLLPNASTPEQATLVSITECGLPGIGFVAGHFAGYVNVPAGNDRHHVQVHFRVRR